jgi:hypothetical protein
MPYLGSSCTSFKLPDPEDEDTVIPQNIMSHLLNFTTSHPRGLEMYALLKHIIADLCIVKQNF